MPPRRRTVIVDPSAQNTIDEFTQTSSLFEAMYEGIEWVLAHNPSVGEAVEFFPDWWHMAAPEWPSGLVAGLPVVWVLYKFDDNEVVIYDFKAVPASPPQDSEEE